jgi:hypothetical protein
MGYDKRFFGKEYRDKHNERVEKIREEVDKQSPITIEQRGGFGGFFRGLFIFIIVAFILLVGGIYLYAYAEAGVFEKFFVESSAIGKVSGFFRDLFINRPREIGNIYSTKTSEDKENLGIKFKEFRALTPYIQSGSRASFVYVLEPSDDISNVDVELECKVNDRNVVEGDIEVSENKKISASIPASYRNLKCSFDTYETNQDKTVYVEGKVAFPYETKRVKLDVYFTKEEIYNELEEDFFDEFNIDEDSVIKTEYRGEPVEVGIGTSLSGESLQPVVIGENYEDIYVGITLNNRWDGKVTKLNKLELYIPNFLKIDGEKSEPSVICPFDANKFDEKGSYVIYRAENHILELLRSFGKGEKENFLSFYCSLKADDYSFEESPYIKDKYMINIGYIYELSSKKAVLKLLRKETPLKEENEEIETA